MNILSLIGWILLAGLGIAMWITIYKKYSGQERQRCHTCKRYGSCYGSHP